MASKLYEKIGASIAKAPEAEMGDDMADDDEDTESPGAMLAEALGISDADSAKVDEALRAAIRKLK